MLQSDTITKIAPALVAAAGQLQGIAPDSTNPAFRSKYISLDALMAAVRPVLAQHGLAVMHGTKHPETSEGGKLVGLTIETRILHNSGEWIASSIAVPVTKSDAQGAGSAISYGRRYGLSALLGLTAEDDDGNAAVAAAPRQPSKREHVETRSEAPAATRMFDAVPTTPRAKPFDGDVGAAMAYKFPFKKSEHHGKPLGEVPEEALLATAKWCRETDAAKFADLLARIEAVIHHWNDNEALSQQDDDSLPF
jgi:hypothetical protein